MKYATVQQGFTIFFAVLVASLALAIGLAIYDLTVRELDLSATANQSQFAIYAADTGAECALYFDLNCSLAGCGSGSAFATSTESVVPSSGAGAFCNAQDITALWDVPAGVSASAATTTFTITFLPQPYCATVTVAKHGSPTQTTITSHGFNTCTPGAPTRLERTLQVTY